LNELAAKQDAFEEANRLKNQFRALDEDEVEFLDSVLESTRAEEDRVKKETAEGLALFRKQQEEADKKARRGSDGTGAAEEGSPPVVEESWVAGGRKRKRMKEKEGLKGVKLRKSLRKSSSFATETTKPSPGSPLVSSSPSVTLKKAESKLAEAPSPRKTQTPSNTKPSISATAKGSLVDYTSDEDDDW